MKVEPSKRIVDHVVCCLSAIAIIPEFGQETYGKTALEEVLGICDGDHCLSHKLASAFESDDSSEGGTFHAETKPLPEFRTTRSNLVMDDERPNEGITAETHEIIQISLCVWA